MRHNYPPYPLLNPIVGVSFLIGLIFSIYKFLQLLWIRIRKGEKRDEFVKYAFLLSWFFVLSIPEFLANEGNPHALRSIGTLPVVILISTIPFIWILKKYNQFGHAYKSFTFSMLVFVLVFIGISDPIKYFVFFANSPKQHEVFDANLRNISDFTRSIPKQENIFIVTGSMERLTIKYLNPTASNITYLYPGEINRINTDKQEKITIVFTNWDWDSINSLRARIPNLTFQQHQDKFGSIFLTLTN